jgi:predicted phage tail protein
MIDITLKGILGKKFGQDWKLEVSSVLEIFEAIEANNSTVSKYFMTIEKIITHFIVFINGKAMPSYLINSKILKNGDDVKIVPILQGGGIELLIIGIILMVASFVLMKVLSPKSPKDVKTGSTVLGSIRNVLSRNIVVPLGYGRLRIGSAVVSNDIRVSYLDSDLKTFDRFLYTRLDATEL